eukprot:TRINITY_DN324_c2_g1_i2.p1 TRINITY_DN324_c2_g1~~TRINITY_DN324_c2_g1_i2.p1  ORF type:complete len:202 (-),score=-18.94 TRINITY_DN324_c2_g1_i2:85-690(-)
MYVQWPIYNYKYNFRICSQLKQYYKFSIQKGKKIVYILIIHWERKHALFVGQTKNVKVTLITLLNKAILSNKTNKKQVTKINSKSLLPYPIEIQNLNQVQFKYLHYIQFICLTVWMQNHSLMRLTGYNCCYNCFQFTVPLNRKLNQCMINQFSIDYNAQLNRFLCQIIKITHFLNFNITRTRNIKVQSEIQHKQQIFQYKS